MRMRAFTRLGHDVRGVNTSEFRQKASWLNRRIQRRMYRGPLVSRINSVILAAASDFHPDLIWAEKQEFIRPETLERLRAKKIRLIHFTPDPYFSLVWKRTPLMDQSISLFDVLVYCKAYEKDEYSTLGKPLIYMPLGYCDETHRPLPSNDHRWNCAAGFVGGWEPRRERLLHAAVANGINLKIWGVYWDFLRDGKWTLRRHSVLRQLAGPDSFRFIGTRC